MPDRATPYSSEELEAFRQLLLQKREEILSDVEALREEAADANRPLGLEGDQSATPTHDADWGTEQREQSFALRMMEWERDTLREIEEALRRIEGGNYGVCLATGRPIERKRLLAKPWAKFSIEHARTLDGDEGYRRRET